MILYAILLALLAIALGLAVWNYWKCGKPKHDSSKWGGKKK